MEANVNMYLNQIQNMKLENIFGGSEISFHTLHGTILISTIILVLIGILWCFFGLKLVRFWSVLLGFAIGFGIGASAAAVFDMEGTVVLAIGIAAGVILAILGAVLYRVGVFVVVWVAGSSFAYTVIYPNNLNMTLVCLGIGLVAAVLAVVFVEPVTMVGTGLCGAVILGTIVDLFVSFDGAWVQVTAITVFAIFGIWVQFLLESRKRKRQSLEKAEEIRKQHSTENEVEKARAMMENLDNLPKEGGEKESSQEDEDDDQFESEYDIEKDDDITFV